MIKIIILLMCPITQPLPFGFYHWDFLTLYPWTICQHSRAQGRCVGRGHLTATRNSSAIGHLTDIYRHIRHIRTWPAPPHAFLRRSLMCTALPSPSYAVSDRRSLKLGFCKKCRKNERFSLISTNSGAFFQSLPTLNTLLYCIMSTST